MKRLALFALLLTACAQNPERPSQPSASPMPPVSNSKYSFEQLQQAALYGTTLIVEDVNAKFSKKKRVKILSCDPKVETMNIWISQIKSMIDVKALEEQTLYLNTPVDQRIKDSKFAQCEKKCNCGAYSEMIGSIDEQKLSAKDLTLKEELLRKHSSLTSAQEKSCLQDVKWFCGSALHSELLKK